MSVVPIKRFGYSEWFVLATFNNTARAEKGFTQWTDAEIYDLWSKLCGP